MTSAERLNRMADFAELLGPPGRSVLLDLAAEHARPGESAFDTLNRLALHEALIEANGVQAIAADALETTANAVCQRLRSYRHAARPRIKRAA